MTTPTTSTTTTTRKSDVAPRMPRISRNLSGEVITNIRRGLSPKRNSSGTARLAVQRTTSFGEMRKRGLGRSSSHDQSNANATFSTGSAASSTRATSPVRGVAKASSFRDTRKRGLKRSTSNPAETQLKRTVSFGEEQVRTVEVIDPKVKNDVWYTKKQLNTLHKLEIRKNLLNQLKVESSGGSGSSGKRSSLEAEDCTWRGMENLEKETERVERIQAYVRTIILEHKSETSSEELKKIAKAMSKVERDRAHSMGLQDEMDVRPAPSKVGGRQLIGRTLSGSLSWMKRSNSRLMPSNKKGGLATAA